MHVLRPAQSLMRVSLGVLSPAVALTLAATLLTTAPAGATERNVAATLPTVTELRDARLKVSDLPSDYRRDYSDGDDDSSSHATTRSSDPECTRRLEQLNDGVAAAARSAHADFRVDKTWGPFIVNRLAAWRTKAPVTERIGNLRALIRNCDRSTETLADGTKATMRLTRLPMPAFGADRVALRIKLSLRQGFLTVPMRMDLVMVRVRSSATQISVVSVGDPADVDPVELARVSTRRLQAVV